MKTDIVRCSDFSLPDDSPERMPKFDMLTGEKVEDPALWHLMTAFHAVQMEVEGLFYKALQGKKCLVILYNYHFETDGPLCRAVVTANIAEKGRT